MALEPRLLGRILQAAEASGLRLAQARMANVSSEDAGAVRSRLNPASLSAGPAVALQFVGEDATSRVRHLCEHVQDMTGSSQSTILTPTDEAADTALTKQFLGTARERLPSARELSGKFENCSCVLILPSAISTGQSSALLVDLQDRVEQAGLTVSAMRTLDMTRLEAEEFLEVYKQVVPDFVVRSST